MKRLFIYSMLVASSLGAMTSCSDFLDVKPVGAVSEEELLNQEGVNRSEERREGKSVG